MGRMGRGKRRRGVFQYPQSDRRRCNRFPPHSVAGCYQSFQYPQSDRRRCNWDRRQEYNNLRPLFQYPQSDRRRCNFGKATAASIATSVLSVSSVGSEALQLSWVSMVVLLVVFFQYPQSDRRRCNWRWCAPASPSRWSFQYPQSDRRRCNLGMAGNGMKTARTFSILSRIGGVATNEEPPQAMPVPVLSVSSVGSEALQLVICSLCDRDALYFQYPQSDRRRCNQERGQDDEDGKNGFQYPQSDRRRCNMHPASPRPFACKLSVSSVGSEALQPHINPS